MKKRRLVLWIAILFCAMMVLTACGGDKNTNSSEDSNTQQQSSGNTDNSGNTGTVVTGDVNGSKIAVGDGIAWPTESMGNLPKPNGKAIAVVKDNSACTVAFAELSKEDATAYVLKIKALGYKSILESADTDGIMFSGVEESTASATFVYSYASKEGTILYVPKTN